MATQPGSENSAAQAASQPQPVAAAGSGGGVQQWEGEGGSEFMRDLLRSTPSWLVSAVVHMMILLGLALIAVDEGKTQEPPKIVSEKVEEEEIEKIEEDLDEPDLTHFKVDDVIAPQPLALNEQDEELDEISPFDEEDAAVIHVELDPLGDDRLPWGDSVDVIGTNDGDGFSGRGPGRRTPGIIDGISEESELAVARALKWLAEHQMPDGGWSFNHHQHPNCAGKCRNPGTLGNEGRIAATALALLPFLGVGQTHKEGVYKTTVHDGLRFLVYRMKRTPRGGSLHESGGRMYSHGLASIALCEAYAMTRDKGLQEPAQMALNFISYAQDPVGGGWRYAPRQAGDTSVVGWQIMALKSGHMAYLKVLPNVVEKAYAFLDSVQSNSGANYGYVDPGSSQATTAIGLLCRMYLGWDRDDPRLARGAKWLSTQGPSKGNMYYNYYATQVIRHFDSQHEKVLWNKWNDVMRDQLVHSQIKAGHETGSWHQKGDHGADRGGRLYVTAMSTMILEVYYRHMPLYQPQSTDEEFPR